ncbi:BON domain-containing protein [Erythrobacter sp.]|uniref:BON domain-containing protein n=1 Tax=Erythrobacter sp. TaxID=1042 RepID=UPI001425ED8B|nr:BON domain-containing protein [Erythrobacter sp.]QIQ87657.1 MAG: BON domain-containing protein [Erythrobacter sp.]
MADQYNDHPRHNYRDDQYDDAPRSHQESQFEPYRDERGHGQYGEGSDRFDERGYGRSDRFYEDERRGGPRGYRDDAFEDERGRSRHDRTNTRSYPEDRDRLRRRSTRGERSPYDDDARWGTMEGREWDRLGGSRHSGRRNPDPVPPVQRPSDSRRSPGAFDDDRRGSRRSSDDRADRSRPDHRGHGPANYKRSDERLMEDACERLTHDPAIDARQITVKAKDNEITLDGHVWSRGEKRDAEDCVHEVSGVKHVQNNLRIAERDEQITGGGGSKTART